MSGMITATVVGGAIAANASDKAMKAQRGETDKAIAQQEASRKRATEMTSGYRGMGDRAISSLEQMMSGDYSQEDLAETPGYQFRLDEGYKGLERSQAGRRLGGRAAKEAMRYGQGYASNEFGNRFKRLSKMADYGKFGVSTALSSDSAAAGNISQMNMKQGENYSEYQQDQGKIGQGTFENAWAAYNQ